MVCNLSCPPSSTHSNQKPLFCASLRKDYKICFTWPPKAAFLCLAQMKCPVLVHPPLLWLTSGSTIKWEDVLCKGRGLNSSLCILRALLFCCHTTLLCNICSVSSLGCGSGFLEYYLFLPLTYDESQLLGLIAGNNANKYALGLM